MDLISTQYDDVENNIVDRWRYETGHTYTLTLSNGDAVNVLLNDIIQLNLSVTDNGITVANPIVTFTSSDSNTISVDNSGKVMGIAYRFQEGKGIVNHNRYLRYTKDENGNLTIVKVVSDTQFKFLLGG